MERTTKGKLRGLMEEENYKKQVILEMYNLVGQPGFENLTIQELYNSAEISLKASKQKFEETQYEMIEELSKEGGQ